MRLDPTGKFDHHAAAYHHIEAYAMLSDGYRRLIDGVRVICRLRWEPEIVAVWENRLCVHQAHNDYEGYRREMYRTTAGEVPA